MRGLVAPRPAYSAASGTSPVNAVIPLQSAATHGETKFGAGWRATVGVQVRAVPLSGRAPCRWGRSRENPIRAAQAGAWLRRVACAVTQVRVRAG